jgi:hypothetical protein
MGHRLIAFEKIRGFDTGREFRVTPSGVSSRYRSITLESVTVEPPVRILNLLADSNKAQVFTSSSDDSNKSVVFTSQFNEKRIEPVHIETN